MKTSRSLRLGASAAALGLSLIAQAQVAEPDATSNVGTNLGSNVAIDPELFATLPEEVQAQLRAQHPDLFAEAPIEVPDFVKARMADPNWQAWRGTPRPAPTAFGQIDEFTYQRRKEDIVRWDNPNIRVPLDINLMVDYPDPIDKRDFRTPDVAAPRLPNEIFVAFKPGYTLEQQAKAHALAAGTVIWTSDLVPDLYQVRLPNDDITAAINIYLDQPEVLFAHPNFSETLTIDPNDPIYNEIGSPRPLWGLYRDDAGASRATLAWDEHQGDQDFVIAVIDTGVYTSHADLADNIWVNPGEIPGNGIDDDNNNFIDDVNGWNFMDQTPNVSLLCDTQDHGTHVAGTIAARGNNGYGVVGVNWRARIMALRTQRLTDCICGSNPCGINNTVPATTYAVTMGARVSNHSYGSYSFNPAAATSINAAQAAGHIVVAAAGNDGNDNDGGSSFFPASYNLANIISVSAINPNSSIAGFSNYGFNSVDIGAPGVGITSTVPRTYLFSDFDVKQGTSMAAPHVAGTVALAWSKYPDLNWMQVKDLILTSGDVMPPFWTFNSCSCHLNTFRALGMWYSPVSSGGVGNLVSPASYGVLAQRLPLSGPAGGGNWSTINLLGGSANVGNITIRGPRFIRASSPTVIRP